MSERGSQLSSRRGARTGDADGQTLATNFNRKPACADAVLPKITSRKKLGETGKRPDQASIYKTRDLVLSNVILYLIRSPS